MRTAAKAMIKTLVLLDAERGALFLMERAQTHMVAAAPDQPDFAAHQFSDVNSMPEVVEHRAYPVLCWPRLALPTERRFNQP